ncbi:hypothetical protein ES703_57901 [subsurface metagenome]
MFLFFYHLFILYLFQFGKVNLDPGRFHVGISAHHTTDSGSHRGGSWRRT